MAAVTTDEGDEWHTRDPAGRCGTLREGKLTVDGSSTSTAADDPTATKRRTRATLSVAAFMFLYCIGIASLIGPLPELFLKRECDSRGLKGGDAFPDNSTMDCKKGDDDTIQHTKYDDAQKAATRKNLVFSVASGLVSLFAVPLIGVLGDAYGRRIPFVVNAAVGIGYCAALALLPAARQMDALLAVSIAAAGGGGMFAVCANAFASVADMCQGVPTATRARMFAAVETCLWVGLLAGPLLCGIVADQVGLQGSFWVPAGCNAACLVIAVAVFPETLEQERRTRPTLRRSTPFGGVFMLTETAQSAALGSVVFFAIICSGATTYVGPFYVKKQVDWGATEIGAWQSATFGSSAIGLGCLLPLFTRYLPLDKIVLISMISCTITTTAYSVATVSWALYALAGAKLLEAMLYPVSRAAIASIFGNKRYGECLSAVGILQNIGTVIGPLYNLLYAATEDATWGPVHGITFLAAGGFGVAGIVSGLCCPRIDAQPASDDPESRSILDGSDGCSRISVIP